MPLLMIPGPIEVSPAVAAASSGAPPGHLAPALIAAFGRALASMRTVWRAGADAQPFCIAGSGTLAMDIAVANLVDAGARVLVVNTGTFSDRLAEMLERRGARVDQLRAPVGDAPAIESVGEALARGCDGAPYDLLGATHVDTSTGVRIDPGALCEAARPHGTLTLFDGVCATAAERFEMEDWGADCYLTASQKAIGLPPGLALLVLSARGQQARAALSQPPPLSMDLERWTPIMRAYEAGGRSYFSTPATTLVRALDVGLGELVAEGMEAVFARHARAARAMRAAWAVYGLAPVPVRPALAANTLSALRLPAGVDTRLVAAIAAHGAVVAGGLHPEIAKTSFRVGHMGYSTTRPDHLMQTVEAVGRGLHDCGVAVDLAAAARVASDVLAGRSDGPSG